MAMRKKRILIVDDEPDYVEMIKMRLEASDYEVITANDGRSGLDAATAERPNLILLDVMMPGMDGFEVLKELRSTPGTKTVPVIMLTARGETKSIFKAQNMGITDYLTKPCDSKELLALLARFA